MSTKTRVCVVGAGPSGMSILFQFDKLRKEGKEIPEVVCYEGQSEVGGLWNYSWRTGTDEYGDPIPNSQYRYLWSNGPKEALEFPDYTFEEHFGKPIPSYPPREVLLDYLKGRWSKADYRPWVQVSHKVYNVSYNDETNDFTVVVKNKVKDTFLPPEKFDYVIVASGHFSVPNVPDFPGIQQFPGRVLHAHDFRDARQFAGQRLLLVGASYSAEDIALQCIKYGAKSVVCTWRTKQMGFKWPPQITERPLLQKIEGNTVFFKDGSLAEFDAIIMCTGYIYSFPFLGDSLRLKSQNILYPKDLYRSVLYVNGGKNKLLYIGMTDQYWTFTYFDVQAKWCVNYIMGENKLPNRDIMDEEQKKWISRHDSLKGYTDDIHFQGDLVNVLAEESNYGHDLDVRELLLAWEQHKYENILTYRDQSFASKYTRTKSPIHHSTFMDAMDDSLECFLGNNYKDGS